MVYYVKEIELPLRITCISYVTVSWDAKCSNTGFWAGAAGQKKTPRNTLSASSRQFPSLFWVALPVLRCSSCTNRLLPQLLHYGITARKVKIERTFTGKLLNVVAVAFCESGHFQILGKKPSTLENQCIQNEKKNYNCC